MKFCKFSISKSIKKYSIINSLFLSKHFSKFWRKIFLGKLFPCLYLAHFSCGAAIFLPTFDIFNSFQTIFFYGFKILFGMIAWDDCGWCWSIHQSAVERNVIYPLASMPSSLLKFCTHILASWPLESHCMKELVVEGLRLCIRRGAKTSFWESHDLRGA